MFLVKQLCENEHQIDQRTSLTHETKIKIQEQLKNSRTKGGKSIVFQEKFKNH